mgnify:CR=1 FL=1
MFKVDPKLLDAGDHNGSTFYQHQRFNAVVRGEGEVEVTLADGATNDTLACYSWSAFPRERINLNIRGGGPLAAKASVGMVGVNRRSNSVKNSVRLSFSFARVFWIAIKSYTFSLLARSSEWTRVLPNSGRISSRRS